MKKKNFAFIAELDSVPFTRPARSTYVLTKDRKFREDLAWIAGLEMKVQNCDLFTGALKVTVKVYRNCNATTRKFGDTDNHLKNIFDALNGVVWKDDSQIVELTCIKRRNQEPKIEITVQEVIK